MKVTECAYDADVADKTVRRWIASGLLKAQRRGIREIYVDPEEWEKFCDKQNIRRKSK